jgi:hypothetical protein
LSSLLRRVASTVAACALVTVGAQLLGITAASAHYNTVSGVAHCQQNGTYTVTWTVANTYPAENETATVKTYSPTPSLVSPNSLELAKSPDAGSTGTMTQTGIAGNATSATLSVDGLWHPDNFTEDADGTVTLTGTCTSKTPHQPTAPSAKNGACVNYTTTSPSVTIPSDKGVNYVLDTKSVSPGTYPVAAGSHTVSASSTTLTLTGTTHWTYTLTVASGSCSRTTATPVTPTLTQSECSGGAPTSPTLTLTHTRGIDYTVSKSAPYSAGQTVTVTALTHKGYVLGSLPASWTKTSDRRATRTITFNEAPAACSGTAGSTANNGENQGTTSGNSPIGLASTGIKTSLWITVGSLLVALGIACLVLGAPRRRFNR